jgi:hypothetical protein
LKYLSISSLKMRYFLCLSLAVAFLLPNSALAQMSALDQFFSGDRVTYSSIGNPKAKGLEVTFEYPTSWGGADGKRPNMLFQVTSEKGRGLEICNLAIREIIIPPGESFTEKDAAEIFNPGELKDFVPQGGVFIDGKQTKLDGQPAAWIKFRQEIQRAGMTLQTMFVLFPVYYDRKLIFFSCGVGDDGDTSLVKVEQRFNLAFPLFRQMANSIIIHSRWKR